MCHIVGMENRKIPRHPYQPFVVMEFYGDLKVRAVSGEAFSIIQRCMAPSSEEIRDLLLNLRDRMQWSRSMLAAMLGIGCETLRRWESGERNPSGAARRLIWLMDLLLCHPEKLNNGLDLIVWGKREELIELNKTLEELWTAEEEDGGNNH